MTKAIIEANRWIAANKTGTVEVAKKILPEKSTDVFAVFGALHLLGMLLNGLLDRGRQLGAWLLGRPHIGRNRQERQ